MRNSAGGIATALGAILVLPSIVGIFVAVTQAEWAANLGNLLPSAAGARLYAYPTTAFVDPMQVVTPLEPWQGGLVLLVWIAALFVLASVLLKRRDA